MWILGCIAVLLLHHIFAGIVWTLIAVRIPILPAFLTQDNAAVIGAEFRLVIVRPIAALAGITRDQGL